MVVGLGVKFEDVAAAVENPDLDVEVSNAEKRVELGMVDQWVSTAAEEAK